MKDEQKIIKSKLRMLELAQKLGNKTVVRLASEFQSKKSFVSIISWCVLNICEKLPFQYVGVLKRENAVKMHSCLLNFKMICPAYSVVHPCGQSCCYNFSEYDKNKRGCILPFG